MCFIFWKFGSFEIYGFFFLLQAENTFEDDIKRQVNEALRKKNTKTLVESMAQMLLSEKNNGQNNGIIIDWLEKIDPELKELKIDVKQKVN